MGGKESLQREYTAVALHEASARFGQAAIDILRGNDDGAEIEIGVAEACFREGTAAFREIQAGRIVAEAAP